MKARDVRYARQDFHFALGTFFRPLPRGGRGKERIEIIYENSDAKIRIVSPWKLGIDDESVLLSVLALAGPFGEILSINDRHSIAEFFRKGLGETAREEILIIETSLYRLCKLTGKKDGGKTKKDVERSMERLAAVTVIVEIDNNKWSSHLLSFYRDKERQLKIAINGRNTKAILGDVNHAHINLEERAELKNDTAKAVHRRLSGWIWPGHTGRIGIETLILKIFGEENFAQNLCKRRSLVRNALMAMNRMYSWNITIEHDMILIRRGKLRV